jgi:hypothetical protein
MVNYVAELKRDFESHPQLDKKFKDIVFLLGKLNYLKKEITDSYDSFMKKLVQDTLDKNKQHLPKEKNNTQDIKLRASFYTISGNDALFYTIDSFLIDLRRCVEFALRLTLINKGLPDNDNFSVDSLLQHISTDSKTTPSQFSRVLMKEHSEFVEYLAGDSLWINKINKYRTQSMHYNIVSHLSHFSITFEWNSMQKFTDMPSYDEPKLPIFNIPVKDFVNSYLVALNFFMEQIIKLNYDIIQTRRSENHL